MQSSRGHIRPGYSISYIAAAAIIASVMFGGCRKSPGGGGMGMPGMGTPQVAVVTVQAERVPMVTELPGRTSAYLVAEVRPQVNGIIQKRLFTEGADVKEGESLYQIDPAMYHAAYDNAVASLNRSQANLPSAQARFDRYKELVAIKAVSQQEYDDASAAVKQAQADVAYWKAAVESARINLGYTSITAPIAGRIGRSNVTVGALATAHQGIPFATIQQLDPIYVDVPQSSANLLQLKRSIQAGHIKGGGEQAGVKLLLEDGSSYGQEGSLKFSDVTVDPSTGSFILRMVFPNPDKVLLPGMYVRALIPEGMVEDAILVPQQGVSHDLKGNATAMVVDGSDKVEMRVLKTERAIGDKWLVTDGLKSGDRIIVEGLQMVQPGMPVKAVPFGVQPTGAAPMEQAAPAGQK
jgi:membrane fusion protein, multidrug efflux system